MGIAMYAKREIRLRHAGSSRLGDRSREEGPVAWYSQGCAAPHLIRV